MAEFLPMIALSPTMETGKIVKWRKMEGDAIEPGDVICEVETDKATMDYEATSSGVLLKRLADEGDDRAVGQPIAIIGEPDEDYSGLLNEKPAPETAPPSTPTPESQAEAAPSAAPNQKAESAEGGKAGRIKASPLARRLAEQQGIDLGSISGSGPGGRIVKADVEAAARGTAAVKRTEPAAHLHPAQPEGPKPSERAKTPPPSVSDGDRKIPITQMRKVIAQRLSESMFTAPHYFLRIAVRADGLLQTRRAWNEANSNNTVSLNALLMKLAAHSISRYPILNAQWGDGEIIQRADINIGLAVALDDGLITPIVRKCLEKNVLQIEAELRDLVDRAKSGRLKPEEYQGATFTISNLGAWEIEEFTAIINPPGSAILAVGAIVREPVVGDNDEIQVQSRMRLTLSCDHRLIDGAVGAAFLKDLKDSIEFPLRALF